MTKLSPSEARRILLRAQGLDGTWTLREGREGAAQVVERLGYVQIDTIATIARAHHHVFWTRFPEYRPAMLWELLSGDRRVFEFWTHAAAYIPIHDFRFYLSPKSAFAKRPKTRQWLRENRVLVQQVRERVHAEGPLGSADFTDPGRKRGPWWDWKPAKRALETLFRMGELMIAGRRNFHRLYDLTERVLPPEVDTSEPTPSELARFVVRRTLAARGVTDEKRAGWWLRDRKRIAAALHELTRSGEAVPVQIEGLEGRAFHARASALDELPSSVPHPKAVHLLSPFDNLIIDRERTLDFFGFDYRLECYTPAPKRRYGYFTLPILWGDRLIGRLDPKADRKTGTFHIRNLVFESEFQDFDALLPALADTLGAFAAFHGSEDIQVERAAPERVRLALVHALHAPR